VTTTGIRRTLKNAIAAWREEGASRGAIQGARTCPARLTAETATARVIASQLRRARQSVTNSAAIRSGMTAATGRR
jgi:hypothetical protein